MIAPLFPIELAEKDLAYAEAAFALHPESLPITAAARTVLQQAKAAGFGGGHISGIMQLYRTQG